MGEDDDSATATTRPARTPPLFRSTVRAGPKATVATPPAPPTRYQAEGELGEGGMGRVVRGIDRFLGREVALKQSLSDDPAMLDMLLREAEIAARLHHPSIVTIYDVGHDKAGEPFVVMRLVDGKRLGEVVAATTELAARLRLLPRLTSAIQAVAFAHRHGVVHRDLKPDNILLGDLGDTVVIDWGLARELAEPDPWEGQPIGTDGFVSPEQAAGEPADARTDVFALGVTLFYVLSGRMPKASDRLVEAVPGIPRDLATIVETARAPRADDRYRDAELLADELQRFIGGQLVAAHHYGRVQRLGRWLGQRKLATAVIATAVVASAAIGVVSIRGIVAAKAVAERERLVAVAAERHEAERAEQLLVDRARLAVAEDPARALALLDLREHHDVDPGVWAVSVEAAARGVPAAWQAHDRAVTLVLALGGGRVVSGAQDGNVVLRTADGRHRVVASYPGPVTGVVAVPGGFAAGHAHGLDRFDLAGLRIASSPVDAEALTASGPWLAWHDDKAAYARRFDSDAVVRLPANRARQQVVDPGGRWLAVADHDGVRVRELATEVVHILASETAMDVVWSARGDRLVAIMQDSALEWDAASWASPRRTPGRFFDAGYFVDHPVGIDPQPCLRNVSAAELTPITCLTRYTGAFAWTADHLALGDGRVVRLYDGSQVIRLVGAPGVLTRIAIAPGGREIAAGTLDGMVVRWDLAAGGAVIDALEATGGSLIADGVLVDDAHVLYRIDRAGARTRLAPLYEFDRWYTQLAPSRILVFDVDGELRLLRDGAFEVIAETKVVEIAAHGDHEVFARDGDNLLTRYDIATHQGTKITHPAPLSAFCADGAGTCAGYEDGHVWWLDGHDVRHQAELACKPTRARGAGDGLEVACGDRLLAIADGSPLRQLATASAGIEDWIGDADGYTIVTVDHAIWRTGVKAPLVAPSALLFYGLAPGRFATGDPRIGTITVVDARTGTRATLGIINDVTSVSISADGRRVLAVGPHAILRWEDPVPAAGWDAWRAGLTNAMLADPNATLQWRDVP